MRKSAIIICLILMRLADMPAQTCKVFLAGQGLMSSLVTNVLTDRDGMVWVATEDGLHRYDGVKFTVYRHEEGDEHSLAQNYVKMLFQDKDGRLFVGGGGGVQVFNPVTGQFSKPARLAGGHPYHNNVMGMLQHPDGELWVTGSLMSRLTLLGDSLVLTPLDLDIARSKNDYSCFDSEGYLWITMSDGRVCRVNTDNDCRYYSFAGERVFFSAIVTLKDGGVYAGTNSHGVWRYEKGSDSFVRLNLPVETDHVSSLYAEGDGSLLIGTNGCGLKRYTPHDGKTTDMEFDTPLFNTSDIKVASIKRDTYGNLWLGAYQRGLILVSNRPSYFRYIGSHSFRDNVVGSSSITALCHDDGCMWVGTDGDGIYKLKEGTYSRHFAPGTVPATIMCIYRDSRGRLLIGGYGSSGGYFDTKTHRYTQLHLPDHEGKQVANVYAFREDKQNRLWVATMGSGVLVEDSQGDIRSLTIDSGYVNDWCTSLALSPDGMMWVGTCDGAVAIDPSNPDRTVQNILKGQVVHSITTSPDGTIYFATSDGFFVYNGDATAMRRYSTTNGLGGTTVYSVSYDHANKCVWIGCAYSIAHYNVATHDIINFYEADGLHSNEFSKNAIATDTDGHIWFGGIKGINIFNPRAGKLETSSWHVRVTDIYLDGQPLSSGSAHKAGITNKAIWQADSLNLDHTDNSFSVEFSTVEPNAPQGMVCQYSLDGNNWVSLLAGDRRVTFNDLATGTHNLRMRCVYAGHESDIRELTIMVKTPWYATWWARLAYMLLFVALIAYMWYRVRDNRQRQQERQLAERDSKEKEARVQFLVNLSHEIRTPMSLILSPLHRLLGSDNDPVRQRTYRIIYRNGERILNLVNQFMDLRKIDKGKLRLQFQETDLVGFTEDICDVFNPTSVERGISFTFSHDDIDELPIWIDTAYFDKIIVNLLSNAFKYTHRGGEVNVSLSTHDGSTQRRASNRFAVIQVADTGIGISDEDKKRIFERFYQSRHAAASSQDGVHSNAGGTGIGLHLVYSLTVLHHGTIDVGEREDGRQGTVFTLKFPLGDTHLSADDKLAPEEAVASSVGVATIAADLISEDPTFAPGNKSKHHVLLVDDEPEIQAYVADELGQYFSL